MEERDNSKEPPYTPLAQEPGSPSSDNQEEEDVSERQNDILKVPDELYNIPVDVKNYVFVKDPMMELENSNSALIEEQPEWLEILSTYELSTRHHIFVETEMGLKYLFKCKEVSNYCARNFLCGKIKTFKIFVTHIINLVQYSLDVSESQSMVKISKDFIGCCSNENKNVDIINSKNNNTQGTVKSPITICENILNIYSDGAYKYSIKGECYQLGNLCSQCGEVSYIIYSNDGSRPVGEIIKRVVQIGNGYSQSPNIYKINFPLNANSNEKLLLICSVLILSSQYYQHNIKYDNKNSTKNKEI